MLPNLELVRKGGSLNLPARAQRLIALLAVTGGSISRSAAAERLWPDVVNARACASLRATLWGLARGPWSPVVVDNDTLALDSSVESQLESADALAMSVLDGSHVPVDTTCAERLSHDLLPDWADEWLVHEREPYRQLRLHALDQLCLLHARCRPLRTGDHGGAGQRVERISAWSLTPAARSSSAIPLTASTISRSSRAGHHTGCPSESRRLTPGSLPSSREADMSCRSGRHNGGHARHSSLPHRCSR